MWRSGLWTTKLYSKPRHKWSANHETSWYGFRKFAIKLISSPKKLVPETGHEMLLYANFVRCEVSRCNCFIRGNKRHAFHLPVVRRWLRSILFEVFFFGVLFEGASPPKDCNLFRFRRIAFSMAADFFGSIKGTQQPLEFFVVKPNSKPDRNSKANHIQYDVVHLAFTESCHYTFLVGLWFSLHPFWPPWWESRRSSFLSANILSWGNLQL